MNYTWRSQRQGEEMQMPAEAFVLHDLLSTSFFFLFNIFLPLTQGHFFNCL